MKNMNSIQRIVIKIGSSNLTHPSGGMNLQKIDQLAMVLSDIKQQGKEIVLVSSGAILAGIAKLKLSKRPQSIPEKQAVASVGQCELMFLYDKFFSQYHQIVSQLLLTKTIMDNQVLKTNATNTINTLLENDIIPIINENDSIAIDELVYGDNDTLSAVSASLIDADLLIILSDIDGLYNDDPNTTPDAALIPIVKHIDHHVETMAKTTHNEIGTGGMTTKIQAAKIANKKHIPMIIANGANPNIIYNILHGEYRGTLFDIEEE